MNPNPATFTLPRGVVANATALSEGPNFRRVSVSQDGRSTATFSSAGQGSAMTLEDGSSQLDFQGNGEASVEVALLFTFSPQGSGGPFSPAISAQVVAQERSLETVLTVIAPDVDGADGRTLMTIMWRYA